MKRIVILFLTLSLLMPSVAFATSSGGSDDSAKYPSATTQMMTEPVAPPVPQPTASISPDADSWQPTAKTHYEGSGHASPEEAVLAYLKARAACDLNAMLETFAIETYVTSYNSHARLEMLNFFQPPQIQYLPGSNDYVQQIQVIYRLKEIVDELAMQYIRWLWPWEDFGLYDGKPQLFRGEQKQEQIDAFYSAFDKDGSEAAEAVELIFLGFEKNVLEQVGLTDAQIENYKVQLQKQQTILGCDEMIEMVTHVQQGELDAYLFMRCARYGDRWYNIQSNSTLLGTIIGVTFDAAGLVFSETIE